MCAFRTTTNAADSSSSNGVRTRVAKHDAAKGDYAFHPDTLLQAVHDGRLRKLLQMMELAPASNIHDWALTFHLSDSYLRHLFKQATGVCLSRVLNEQRLQMAARLLTSSNLSIKEIAGSVGYEHTSSFTRAFERRFERSPRSYRSENGQASNAETSDDHP